MEQKMKISKERRKYMEIQRKYACHEEKTKKQYGKTKELLKKKHAAMKQNTKKNKEIKET